MPKFVDVAFAEGEEWTNIEVPNFYDPEKHHTVRKAGQVEKVKYIAMRLPDGRVYDKVKNEWAQTTPEKDNLQYDRPPEGAIEYKDRTVTKVEIKNLGYSDNVIGLLTEVARVLQDAGSFVATVPCASSLSSFSDPEIKTHFTGLYFTHFLPDGKFPLFKHYFHNRSGDHITITLRK